MYYVVNTDKYFEQASTDLDIEVKNLGGVGYCMFMIWGKPFAVKA